MSRPGYEKYLERMNDAFFDEKYNFPEDKLILEALKKDINSSKGEDDLLGSNSVDLLSFINLEKFWKSIRDRELFKREFNKFLDRNKSAIKALFNQATVIWLHFHQVTQVEINLFLFLHRELGYRFYAKNKTLFYISKNKKYIELILENNYEYNILETNAVSSWDPSQSETWEDD